MTSIRAARIVLLAAVTALPGCKGSVVQMSPADSALANGLAGTWGMQFRLIRSPILRLDTAAAPRVIQGKLALLVNRSLDRSFNRIGIPTNYGSYDVDLTPFGFDTRVTGTAPTAVAGRLSDDSVEVILSPESEIGELVLVGRLYGNSVVGRWHVTLPRSGGEGTFVLERVAGPGLKL
jgi:hypothetical protein